MTDTATAAQEPAKKEPTIKPIQVTRNGVSLTLTEQVEPKGPSKDEPYLFFEDTDKLTLDQIANWVDPIWIKNRVARIVKKELKGIFAGAVDTATGIFDSAKFAFDAANYKFYSESIKELQAQVQDVMNEFITTDLNSKEGVHKAGELRMKMANLKLAIENKKRKTDNEDDDEAEATPVAPVKPAAVAHAAPHVHKG